jgi:hypothetical protein
MSNGSGSPLPSPGELLGTKELLQLVVQKLSSQALLFSLAIVVILVATWWLFGRDGTLITVAVLFVFLVGMVGFLFFEEKRKLQLRDPATMAGLVTGQLSTIGNPAAEFSVQVWTTPATAAGAQPRDVGVVPSDERAEYRIGDRIIVHFRATRDCYLTLLNVGTSGKLAVLFPNGLVRDNAVVANRSYEIPGKQYGFDYELQGPPGVERLKAIATAERVELLESHFAPDGSLFRSLEPSAAARDIAIVKRRIDALPIKEWAEATCEFRVRPEAGVATVNGRR